ncbi:HD domain-containing protein [Xanthovirga aplysinae]|uniref:HD domain-containing protein n=1 Tax=Xanthovirga aplysinae TaxID=2529853 RepID=UPI0012BBEBB8|nr:HD domain-containing protein [Xanthovirga aplysinae]MTI29955.1 HD domain-containing protein [Xanthovirga aplysinae]
MKNKEIIEKTMAFVKESLAGAEGGHDWWHIHRVWNNARSIATNLPVDMLVVELAALLHDIADSKFHNGNEELGPQKAGEFLEGLEISPNVVEHVQKIIQYMSFKNSMEGKSSFNSLEMEVVQDADRLDAIGAIGIARAFSYGGFKNRSLHDPKVKPVLNMTKEEYKKNTGPTINHFYEKLLLLKEGMNTKTGRELANQRHKYMEDFLEQFLAEWDGGR